MVEIEIDGQNKKMKPTETTIPKEILEAIKSSSVYSKLESIGARYNLLLDQIGQLEVDTRMVLIGKLPSVKFIDTVARDLEIDKEISEKIVKDINEEIFMPLRESIRKVQEEITLEQNTVPIPPSRPLTPLEKAGNFEIVKDKPVSTSPQYNNSSLNKAQILDGIENPPTTPRVSIVDHLLANPVSSANEIAAPNAPKPQSPGPIAIPPNPQTPPAPTSPKPPVQPAGKTSVDPYREPIE